MSNSSAVVAAVGAEQERATSVEAVLDQKIDTTNTTLDSKITNESSRAQAAEDSLLIQLNAVGVGNKAYKTYALMDADKTNIPAKSKVTVTNDTTASNNGDWQWDGVAFTKSAYDPLTQAKDYSDSMTILDSFDALLRVVDQAGNTFVLLQKNGELYLPNIAKSVQGFLNYLDLKIKDVGGRVEYDEANSSIKILDVNGALIASISAAGALHVCDVVTKNGSVESRLSNLETNAVSDIKSEMLKNTDYAIAARDDSALLNVSLLFSLEELSVAYVFASSICRLSKREYLIFCEGRVGGDFDPAKLFMRKVTVNPDYSLGLGPVQIAVDSGGTGDTAYSILNACSIKVSTGLHAGRIYLYYLKRFYNTHIDEPYCIYSDDDGATWSTPVDMSPFIPNIVNWKIVAIGPGKAIQLKHGSNAGRIILPCWHGDQNYPGSQAGLKSFILYSDDGGSTYTVGAESMYAGSNECQVAEVNGGGFALLTRDASQQKAIEYSYDGGLTLVDPRKLDEITTTRVQSGFLQCQNNFDLSVPKLIVSTPSKAGVREDIGLWVSYDEKTFQFWKRVATGLGSYSDLIPIDESHVLVTYSAGRADQNRDIKAIVVNLKSILMGE